MPEFVTIAHKDELKPGECKVVEANERTFALYNISGAFYVTDNVCGHKGGPLGDGELDEQVVTCPWHGWEYNVITGENTSDSSSRIETFQVQVQDDEIQIKV